ncbi:MAG: MFS transporter [bacterium]|nr:MFS transporter [bacterium]
MTDVAATSGGRGSLTRGEARRAMRGFIAASGFWGMWGQTVGIGTAVFTGYALHLGADAAYVALFTSVAYLLAVGQLIVPVLGRKLRRRKRYIVSVGFAEILFRSSPALIPFLFVEHLRLEAMMVFVGIGLLCGYSLSPFYNTWVINAVPENIRARFTSRQTIISTLVAMFSGFAVGRYIDSFAPDEKQVGFNVVFGVGALFGWLGYTALSRTPFASGADMREGGDTVGGFTRLMEPFRDRNFTRAVLCFGAWTLAVGIDGSLYGVFMIEHLEISYTEISLFNAVFMVTSIAGYRLWASLVDRFGSKPVLQILMVPTAFLPLIWAWNAPGAYYLVPVALALSGILFSGIIVAATPLLYGLVPAGEQRPYYMASWSATVNLMGAVGPFVGSLLVRLLRDISYDFNGFNVGHLQIIFMLSVVARVPAILLLKLVSDRGSISSRHLLSHLFRGNLLSYTFNTAVYNIASQEERRARAALALGRSGSPLAIEQLIQALADASPVVRRSAARALGETGSPEASESLIRELLDGESDIRSEAAEALGRLGHQGGIDPLINSLDDVDPRVRISAIRGLSEIGGPEVRELLFWYFGEHLDDTVTFPTLVDVLSHMGDHRVVKPTLHRIDRFRSAAVRLQLLNGTCHALGADGEFYRLLSYDESRRATTLTRLLRRASNSLSRSAALDVEVREQTRDGLERMRRAHDGENLDWMEEAALQVAGAIRDGLSATGRPPFEVLSIYLVILALESFLQCQARMDLPEAREIFVTVCISRIGILVAELETSEPRSSDDDEPLAE